LHHSLSRLDASLRARGGSLCLRIGGSLQALLSIAAETRARQVYWNRIYDPALVARDTGIKVALTEAGFECESFNAALLAEPWEVRTGAGEPYRVFTPFWRACSARLDALPRPLPPPPSIRAPVVAPSSEALDGLQLLPRARWALGLRDAWSPGEDAALDRIEAFAAGAVADYPDGRNHPDTPAPAPLAVPALR
jgi:deoxyribodipyrimidine photo-lyase